MNQKLPTVQEVKDIVENMIRWQDAFAKDSDSPLFDSISKATCWHFYKHKGTLIAAPSRFIGYKDMTPEKYMSLMSSVDGKETERAMLKLRREPTPQENELAEKTLSDLFKIKGRKPNVNAKFFIVEQPEVLNNSLLSTTEHETAITIVNMVKSLPPAIRDEVMKNLAI